MNIASNEDLLKVKNEVSGKESTANKVQIIDGDSTHTQYPTAKCVYDMVGNIATLLQALR